MSASGTEKSQAGQEALLLRPDSAGGWRLSTNVYVADQPGELASIATHAAQHGANIEVFAFNRTQDMHRVRLELRCASAAAVGALVDGYAANGYLTKPVKTGASLDNACRVTETAGLLRLKVGLENVPGTLARFAAILKEHSANVLYMAYNDAEAPGIAEITLAAPSPDELSTLLQRLGQESYHFHVEWTGAQGGPVDTLIGLNAIEAFLFQLKALLPDEKLSALRELLQSSDELRSAMLDFRREAGESDASMAASEIFANILQLAAASLGKTGRNFLLRLSGPLHLTPQVSLYCLSCPTGANGYLLRDNAGYTLIDSSYGLYFNDAMHWLAGHGLDPSRIHDALFTHPDADHAGWARPLHERYGTRIFMHPDCLGVFLHENRAWGSETRLLALNGAYTRLINRITELQPPPEINAFPQAGLPNEMRGGFRIAGRFLVGDLELELLESRGGHVPGQVFPYAPKQGILFSGDYLIDVLSLSDRAKSTLTLARLLITSTNSDSRVFGAEMEDLKELMRKTRRRLAPAGLQARIFPGHGDYYTVDEADWGSDILP